MPWTDPFTAIPGQMMTAALWNVQVRDNLLVLKTSLANDGKLDATGGSLRKPNITQFIEGYATPAIAGGVLTLDLTYAEHLVLMNANVASIAFVNSPWVAGAITTCTLLLSNDGTPRSFNWGGAGGAAPFVRFSGNAPLVPSGTNGVADIVTMRTYDGSTWWAAVYGQRM
jgi:hypothetical protein